MGAETKVLLVTLAVIGVVWLLAVLAAKLLRRETTVYPAEKVQSALERGHVEKALWWAEWATRHHDLLVQATGHEELGRIAVFQSDMAAAERHHRMALEVRRICLPEDHPDVAVSQHNIALTLMARGRVREAKPLLALSRRMARRAHGVRHEGRILTTYLLALADASSARFEKSEKRMKHALALSRSLHGGRGAAAAEVWRFAGICEMLRGRAAEADRALRRCHEVAAAVATPMIDPPYRWLNHAFLYHGWALLLRDRALLDEAEGFVGSYLDVLPRPFGFPAGMGLTALSRIRLDQGDAEEAMSLATEALALCDARPAADDPVTADALHARAKAALALQQARAARASLDRGVVVLSRCVGPRSFHLSGYESLRGLIDTAEHRYDEAEAAFRRAALLRRVLPVDHPHHAFGLRDYATYCDAVGKRDEARVARAEADRIAAMHLRPAKASSA